MQSCSRYFLNRYRSLTIFSSIPSEVKHKTFKVDMRHTFRARKTNARQQHLNTKMNARDTTPPPPLATGVGPPYVYFVYA